MTSEPLTMRDSFAMQVISTFFTHSMSWKTGRLGQDGIDLVVADAYYTADSIIAARGSDGSDEQIAHFREELSLLLSATEVAWNSGKRTPEKTDMLREAINRARAVLGVALEIER